MDSLRGNHKINLPNNNIPIQFQIIDWLSTNEEILEDNGKDDKYQKYNDNNKYVIRTFGVTKSGKSISVNIHDFPPHYYINVPDNFNMSLADRLVSSIKMKLPKRFQNSITSYDIIKRKKFWGFTNNKLHKFIRILFKNTQVMMQVSKVLKEPLQYAGGPTRTYEPFETNITPFLRFIHINNLLPAGWMQIKPNKYKINHDSTTTCQLDLDVFWRNVEFLECNDMAPFITASFDIEADSSHGDFPLAKKNYKKLGGEVIDVYQNFQKENKKKKKIVDIIDKNSFVYNLIVSAFNHEDNTHIDISKVYTKNRDKKPSSNIIKAVSKKVVEVLETTETYKLLAYDILENIGELEDEIDESLLKQLIMDAYATNTDEKTSMSIRRIYTKSSKNPTKTSVKDVLNKGKKNKNEDGSVQKLYNKVFNVIQDIDNKESFINYYIKSSNIQKLNDKAVYISEKTKVDIEEVKSYISVFETLITQITSIFTEYLPEIDPSRDTYIKRVTEIMDEYFQGFPVEGDKVIQIGTVVQKYGESGFFLNHIVTLDTCSDIPGAVVVQCETEEEVLLEWANFIKLLDPDIITGYNIFGFDFSYMWQRAEELDIVEEFGYLGRLKNKISELECKTLTSSALGDNNLSYITMNGRVQMDLFKVIQKDHNLVSYKLDYVAETFMNDDITEINGNKLTIKGAINLNVGNYITIGYGNEGKYLKGKKLKIKSKDGDVLTMYEKIDKSIESQRPVWSLAKDDVSPQDIFRLQKGSANDRCIVATYCVMDCALCLHLINKLDIITNNIGMANVCFVPLSYLFLRGQGIKIFSFVAKQCRKEKFLLPVVKCKQEEVKVDKSDVNLKFDWDESDHVIEDNDGGYEGAIVLKPTPGIYLDTPVSVMDYASLYPSSMISENLSHDSIILDEKYMGDDGIKELEKLGYGYVDVTHDVFKWIDPNIKSKGKVKTGVKTCRFAQPKDGSKGIIPRILQALLKARKDTRKKIKTEPDPFKRSVLDGLQLAYKITANSLYGQIGARTSPIYLKDIAASTTATGRKLLHLARDKVHEKFEGSNVVYGDTDSIFVNFNAKDKDGNPLKGKEGLKASIDLGVQAEEYIKGFLKPPHNLEYEKTFWPFILFSKKRYIGHKYEFDLDKYKQTSMGIVLKRRDNADIVKHVYGGVIDIIMNEKNIEKSITFLKDECRKLLNGKFPMDKLVITKSLRGFYKNPDQIAHKVLADRMGKRDPGNKPSSNDRIPFVYIETNAKKGEKVLQGDRIEHPQYILDNDLNPDYKFYITNQIMKPVGQIYALIVEQLKGYNKPKGYFERKYKALKNERGDFKAKNKITDLRHTEASKILFDDVLRVADNKRNRNFEITDFFKVKNIN